MYVPFLVPPSSPASVPEPSIGGLTVSPRYGITLGPEIDGMVPTTDGMERRCSMFGGGYEIPRLRPNRIEPIARPGASPSQPCVEEADHVRRKLEKRNAPACRERKPRRERSGRILRTGRSDRSRSQADLDVGRNRRYAMANENRTFEDLSTCDDPHAIILMTRYMSS